MTGGREHLARLPAEIFLLVAEDPELSTRDLSALARTSRRYAHWVIPVLYTKHVREENASALLWAVLKENTGTMALLIKFGADINSVEASTRLYQSPPYRWIECLRRWNCGTQDRPPNYALAVTQVPTAFQLRQEFMFAPLALAVRIGHIAAAKWLLENGADPEVTSQDLCYCKKDLTISTFMWRVLRHLRPIDLHPGKPHWTSLHLAIHYGHNDIVQLLVAHGADTRQVCRSADGPWSALHTAFDYKRGSIIEFLMHRFKGTDMVDINARGRGGVTPLHLAYMSYTYPRNQSLQFVDMALKFGADIDLEYEVDQNQWTLFAIACVEGDSTFAMRLLDLGANAFFDLEQESGGRWTTSDFRGSIGWSLSTRDDPNAEALAQKLDQSMRDHEVAWL